MGFDVVVFFLMEATIFIKPSILSSTRTEPMGPQQEQQTMLSLQTGVVLYVHADQTWWAELPPTPMEELRTSLWKNQARPVDVCGPLCLDYIYGWIHRFIKRSWFVYLGPSGIQMKKLLYTWWKKWIQTQLLFWTLESRPATIDVRAWSVAFCTWRAKLLFEMNSYGSL